jgi:hypothetical protein
VSAITAARTVCVVARSPAATAGTIAHELVEAYLRGEAEPTYTIQDKDVVEKVEKKDLVELSCGYTCDVDHTPGTYNGEKYDAIQKNIRYNHVALGAKDFGRAGSEVKLRMDGAGLCVETAGYAKTMELDAALKEIDRLKGELAGASTRADAAEKRVKEINVDVLVADRLALFEDARSVLGDVKLDGKTDKEIMAETCATAFPDLKLDNASEDYLRGLFNAAATQAKLATENVKKGNVTVHADSLEDKVTKARERNDQRSKDAWKGKK